MSLLQSFIDKNGLKELEIFVIKKIKMKTDTNRYRQTD
jgi:hypothetical protein